MAHHIGRLITDVKAFVLSSAILTAFDLGLFTSLDSEPLSRNRLKAELAIRGHAADVFLDVLVANGYLEETDEGLALTEVSRAVLPTLPELKSWAKEMELTFHSLVELREVLVSGDVTSTPLSRFWGYKASDADSAAPPQEYSKLMDSSGGGLYELVAGAVDFNRYERVIDLGGGFGGLATLLASVTADTQFVAADLPAVAVHVEKLARERGVDERVRGLGLDFMRDPIPSGFDAFVLCRVVHDWDDDSVIHLLKNIRLAMDERSELIIVENLAPPRGDGSDPSSAATAMMLALLGGKRRSSEDLEGLMRTSGVKSKEHLPLGKSRLTAISATLSDDQMD